MIKPDGNMFETVVIGLAEIFDGFITVISLGYLCPTFSLRMMDFFMTQRESKLSARKGK